MLRELSKYDDKWRKCAYNICRNKQLSDDLVNDMYIKLHETGKTFNQINDFYIIRTIKNLFLNHIKSLKEVQLNELILENPDNKALERRLIINEALEELDLFDREILLHSRERSYSENQEYLGIHRMAVYRMQDNAMQKLKNTDTIKKYKDAG